DRRSPPNPEREIPGGKSKSSKTLEIAMLFGTIVTRYRPCTDRPAIKHTDGNYLDEKTMRDSIRIRPAQPVDAEGAAVLLYSAYTHTHVTYPLREEHESGLIERLEHFFRQDGNRFSYQNIQLAEQSSEVVGLVLS